MCHFISTSWTSASSSNSKFTIEFGFKFKNSNMKRKEKGKEKKKSRELHGPKLLPLPLLTSSSVWPNLWHLRATRPANTAVRAPCDILFPQCGMLSDWDGVRTRSGDRLMGPAPHRCSSYPRARMVAVA